MTLPIEIISPTLTALGTLILSGIGFIIRTLTKQNQTMTNQGNTLAALVTKIGTLDPGVINQRISALELSDARQWAIYDAYSASRNASPTLDHQ